MLAASAGLAQDWTPFDSRVTVVATADAEGGLVSEATGLPVRLAAFNLSVAVPPARMSPELALTAYMAHASRQRAELGAYSDATTIEADLPDTAQHGKFELRRYFQAPRSLAFAGLRFAGDSWVKTNVIARLLQSEVEHVQKGEGAQTAITAENYKFSFKGFETIDGRVAYIYQVKPRHKRPGVFKGRILVDASSGRLRRAEGTMVKSPSFFIKRIEFVQDYGEYGRFSLPVHIHSEAKTRLVGRAVVEVYHRDYRAITMSELQSLTGSSAAGGSSSN